MARRDKAAQAIARKVAREERWAEREAKYVFKPGDRVTLSRAFGPQVLGRKGTLEEVQGSYALVVWDDGLGPYRSATAVLAKAEPEEV